MDQAPKDEIKTYANALWNDINQVVSQSSNQRKLIEQLIDILEIKVKVEEKYSQGLAQVQNQMFQLASKSKNNLLNFLSSLMSTKYELQKQLISSFQDEIIIPITALYQSQQKESKNIIEECKKFDKDFLQIQNDIKHSIQDYKYKKREYEQSEVVNFIYKICSEYTEEKRLKQSEKYKEYKIVSHRSDYNEKLYNEAEQCYKDIVKENNKFIETDFKQLTQNLTRLQQHETDRQYLLRDTLVKNIIFETSFTKNLTYDYEKLAEKIQDCNPEVWIQDFINFNSSCYLGKNETLQKEFIENKTFINTSLRHMKKGNTNYFQTQVKEEDIDQIVLQTLQNEQLDEKSDLSMTVKLSEEIWNLETTLTEERSSEVFKFFKQGVSRRLYFCHYLRRKRLDRQNLLSQVQLANLVEILLILLDIALDEREARTVWGLMTLTFCFSTKDSKQLQSQILDHKIWQSRDFWETSIIEQIYCKLTTNQERKNAQFLQLSGKEQKNHPKTIKRLDSLIFKEKNQILSVLSNISQSMLMFQFKLDQTKDIISKFCSFFSLNQEIYKDLLNAIDKFEENKRKMI